MRMTGKEAIEQLKEKYHNYIIDYYYSSNISKEKRDTLYLMYDEEFEAIDKQLTKYKRAFEILKEKLDLYVTEDLEFNYYTLFAGIEPVTISKEEYELLKEVFGE
jgi:hypothetical protein